MANFKNTNYLPITAKQTLPTNVAGTGTLSTEGINVVGDGTLFLSEMQVGSWLVDLTQNEIRKVVRVDSDTSAVLDVAFSSDLAALTAVDVIPSSSLGVKAISVGIKSGLADGEIDGEVFSNGYDITFSKDSNQATSQRDLIDPIIVDGTGTTIISIIMR